MLLPSAEEECCRASDDNIATGRGAPTRKTTVLASTMSAFTRVGIRACRGCAAALASSFVLTENKAHCEQQQQQDPTRPGWWRRSLHAVFRLPTPRLLQPQDPELNLSRRAILARQKDDARVLQIQERFASNRDRTPQSIAETFSELYEVLYGPGCTPQTRNAFLERYGCTGWTDELLDRILDLSRDRGVVEIGAGNGQWTRALNDRFQRGQRGFIFSLAFDDHSQLPLDSQIYHANTKPHRDFMSSVERCDSDLSVLKQFRCRGRVLLLVYPPPSDLAHRALQEYVKVSPSTHDTVVYVGEGRGGANGDDAFFDELEQGGWILLSIHDVHSFGTKGHERCFIFKVSEYDCACRGKVILALSHQQPQKA